MTSQDWAAVRYRKFGLSDEAIHRLTTPPDTTVPLRERLDMDRLRAALYMPIRMDDFTATIEESSCWNVPRSAFNECGTIGCLAGNVLLNEMEEGRRSESEVLECFSHRPECAAKLLNIDYAEIDDLFYTFPDESLVPGTPEYGAAVRELVNAWLGEHGIEERV